MEHGRARFRGRVASSTEHTGNGDRGLFGVIDDHTEVDVQYSLSFGSEQQYAVSIGAINVFDEEPPDTFFRGYSEELHNPFMRQLYGRVSASF